jgi:hypothetical protein
VLRYPSLLRGVATRPKYTFNDKRGGNIGELDDEFDAIAGLAPGPDIAE